MSVSLSPEGRTIISDALKTLPESEEVNLDMKYSTVRQAEEALNQLPNKLFNEQKHQDFLTKIIKSSVTLIERAESRTPATITWMPGWKRGIFVLDDRTGWTTCHRNNGESSMAMGRIRIQSKNDDGLTVMGLCGQIFSELFYGFPTVEKALADISALSLKIDTETNKIPNHEYIRMIFENKKKEMGEFFKKLHGDFDAALWGHERPFNGRIVGVFKQSEECAKKCHAFSHLQEVIDLNVKLIKQFKSTFQASGQEVLSEAVNVLSTQKEALTAFERFDYTE